MIRTRSFLVLLLFALCTAKGANVDNAQLQKQFINYYSQTFNDDNTERILNAINADGTWKNIDYKNNRRGSWPAIEHLDNTVTLAKSYASEDSKFFKNKKLKDAILSALVHWNKEDYTNPNWWYNQIGVPDRMSITFILLGEDLPNDVLSDAMKGPLARTKIGLTGQNKVWLSGITLMIGHLNNDAALMKKASDSIWEELRESTKEGIQPDWSFHQHGPQQQFGNYGLSFSDRMIQWASILKGTDYALSGNKLSVLRNYLLKGSSWVYWKGFFDYNACGRQIEEDAQTDKARSLSRQLSRMIDLDPEMKKAYKLMLSKKNKLIGHKSFWRSEMAIHRTKDWYASVKMSSARIIGSETFNSENMQGLHAGDCALLLYQNGDEYENIIPLWDWNRLPGTTCDQAYGDLTPRMEFGGSDFSGVLGNLKCGMAAMIYKRANLKAHKAYFFTDKEIVCLGAGIEGETKGKVFTSIQQSWLKGDVLTSKGFFGAKGTALNKGNWVYNNNIAYQVLSKATAKSETVKGNWNIAYPDRGDRPEEGELFSLWIDHGKNPVNQSYAYKIFPNMDPEQVARKVRYSSTSIIANTKKVQVVENKKHSFVVFYEPEEVKTQFGNVKVSAPCLMMIMKKALFLSDPLHSSKSIEITINNATVNADLPQGIERGKVFRVQR